MSVQATPSAGPLPLVFDWPAGALSYVERAALHWTIQLRSGPGRVLPLSATAQGSLALAGDAALARFSEAISSARERMLHVLTSKGVPEVAAIRLLGDGLAGLLSPLPSRARVEIGWFVGTLSHANTSARNEPHALDLILVGSAWAQRMLQENGINRAEILPTSVDTAVFRPRVAEPSRREQFVIYSGGELCHRKGQDLVLAAVKAFRSMHPETLLISAWQHPLPELCHDITVAGHVQTVPRLVGTNLQIAEWAEREGLPPGSVIELGYVPESMLANVLGEVDVALFPSRAETDANPWALQTLACGIPTVISRNTGHLDIADEPWIWSLREQRTVHPPRARLTQSAGGTDGWGESSVDEIVSVLEQIYRDRTAARLRAASAPPRMLERDWTASARQLSSFVQRTARGSFACRALAS